MTALVWALAGAFVLVGVAGRARPALPGAPRVFLGLLLAAWTDGFQRVGWVPRILLAVLTLLSPGVDLLARSLGAERVGAGRRAVLGTALGTVERLLFGVPGVLGPFLGAVDGKFLARGAATQAGRAGIGA